LRSGARRAIQPERPRSAPVITSRLANARRQLRHVTPSTLAPSIPCRERRSGSVERDGACWFRRPPPSPRTSWRGVASRGSRLVIP
jgi:hypothetical protein